MESRLQRRFGDGEMGIVRGGDRDDLDPVRALRLFAKQGLVVGVAAIRRDAQLLTERAPALGIDVKRAGQQGINIVTQRRTAVAVADLTGSPPPTMPQRRNGIRVSGRLTWCSPF